jgi:hypothetical protein
MVLSHESPLYSYQRGYPFTLVRQVAAGTEIKITGPPVETGVCDMWSVTTEVNGGFRGVAVSGYIHESDLRPG